MLWTLAVIFPFICVLMFQYIVLSPWHCKGICCFHEDSCVKVSTHGSYDLKFESMVKKLEKSLTIGWDIGASLSVMVDGKTVIDVAGGFKDKDKREIYDTSSMNLIFSCGKIFESIAIAILADRGLLRIEDPVANYWPEYAQNGKEEITIKDILSHRSGSSFQFNETPSLEILQNPSKRDEFIASQKYQYPRGTVTYRHWGSAFISDAICRRVDPQKRTLAAFIKEELFDNKGEVFLSPPVKGTKYMSKISEVHDASLSTILFGLLPQVFLPDIYSKILPDGHQLKINSHEAFLFKSLILKLENSGFDLPSIPDSDYEARNFNNHSSFLSYEMMSGNSISNARALAKAFDSFMNGDVVGKDTLEAFKKPFPVAYDRFIGQNFTYTVGGWALTPNFYVPVNSNCSGWFGIGGPVLFHCKIGNHVATMSYVQNAMSPNIRADRGALLLEDLVRLLSS